MDVELGATYTVRTGVGDGRFVAVAEEFRGDGAIVVLRPVHEVARDIYPRGYALGRAHWDTDLVKVD